jgi:2-aminoadipate transaminase
MNVTSSSSVNFSALGQRAQLPTIARLMSMALESPDVLSLAAGFTDNRTLPVAFVEETVRELSHRVGEPEFLQYGSNQGRAGLRRVVAERLQKEEPAFTHTGELAEKIIVTNGSQQALYLAMQVLCDPGDIVLVDQPSYFVFLEMLVGLGIQTRAIPVTADGKIDSRELGRLLDRLRASGEASRVRAIYFVSYFSNPSGRSLSDVEKNAVAEQLTARSMFIPVLEDAAYRELYFERPEASVSVLGLPAWSPFPRFYLSTLTKPFATGLKIGYGLCTDSEWLAKMAYAKGHHDFGSAHFNQAILETVLRNGAFDRHLAELRPMYAEKCAVLHAGLAVSGLHAAGWRWEIPAGGLYLWLQAPQNLDTGLESDFCRACIAEGVIYVPGELCFGADAPRNFARLSFGVLPPGKLTQAASRFGTVARKFS